MNNKNASAYKLMKALSLKESVGSIKEQDEFVDIFDLEFDQNGDPIEKEIDNDNGEVLKALDDKTDVVDTELEIGEEAGDKSYDGMFVRVCPVCGTKTFSEFRDGEVTCGNTDCGNVFEDEAEFVVKKIEDEDEVFETEADVDVVEADDDIKIEIEDGDLEESVDNTKKEEEVDEACDSKKKTKKASTMTEARKAKIKKMLEAKKGEAKSSTLTEARKARVKKMLEAKRESVKKTTLSESSKSKADRRKVLEKKILEARKARNVRAIKSSKGTARPLSSETTRARKIAEANKARNVRAKRVVESKSSSIQFDDRKFSRLFTDFARENYSDVSSIRVNEGIYNKKTKQLTLECVAVKKTTDKSKKAKTKNLRFVAENVDLDTKHNFGKHSFSCKELYEGKGISFITSLKESTLTPVKLNYNFKSMLEGKQVLVTNRKQKLNESKKSVVKTARQPLRKNLKK